MSSHPCSAWAGRVGLLLRSAGARPDPSLLVEALDLLAEVQAFEREQCARIADDEADTIDTDRRITAATIAGEIRARGALAPPPRASIRWRLREIAKGKLDADAEAEKLVTEISALVDWARAGGIRGAR